MIKINEEILNEKKKNTSKTKLMMMIIIIIIINLWCSPIFIINLNIQAQNYKICKLQRIWKAIRLICFSVIIRFSLGIGYILSEINSH